MSAAAFRFGDWLVDPASNSVQQGAEQRQMEPRAMEVLVVLAARPGEVITSDQLLTTCWGSNLGGDNPVHKTIAQLRKVLGDSSNAPRYIETIRKRGYRTVAPLQHSRASTLSWIDGTPFRGLAPFEERHSAVFFGRADAIAAVTTALSTQVAAGCAMVLVLGPSGSGKTSLLRAGVLARLQDTGAPGVPAIVNNLYFDCADLAETDLHAALASVLLDAELGPGGGALFERDSAASLGQRLAHDPDAVIAQLAALARERGGRSALFIDRFEALLRHPAIDDADRAAFIVLLDRLARSGAMLLLLACRNDFYPHLVSHAPLMALKASGGHVDVAAPSGAEIAQMVRLPAKAASLRFGQRDSDGAALDDELCAAARASPDTLPLLQYCLEELYRQRTADGELRFAVYQQLGGIDGAIGARAEQVLTQLTPAQMAALPQVLPLLVQVAEDELSVTARPAPWSALTTPTAEQLVKALVDARLFTSSVHGGVAVFGLAHEALLRRWPRVSEWIDSHRQDLQIHTRIGAAAKRWEASGRSRDMLLPRGLQVNQARALLANRALGFSALETAFIASSLRRVRRAETARIVVMTLVLVLAVLAVIMGLAARQSQREAEQHRVEAEGLMGFMLGDFVERLRPLGRLDLLDSVSARALAYLAAGEHDVTAASLAQRAKALQVLSEVKMARGDGAGAEAALLLGRDILQRQLAGAPNDPALLKSAGANAFWLGQIHFDRNDWAAAQSHFAAYRDFADRQSAAAPGDPDGEIEQSYAHNSLGSVALERGEVGAAVREFAHSVKLKSAILARMPNNDSLAADLANSLSWQALAQARLGQLDAAMTLYQRESAIMARLHAAAPANAPWTKRYGFALHHLGELNEALGQRALARDDYTRALGLLRDGLSQDPGNIELQGHVEAVEVSLLSSAEDSDATLRQWGELQQRLDASARREPSKKKLARMAALGRVHQAALQIRRKDGTGAALTLAPALTQLAQLQAGAPDDHTISTVYAAALLTQADLATAPGQRNALCEQAQRMLAPLANGSRDYTVLAPFSRAAQCAGHGEVASTSLKALETMKFQDGQKGAPLARQANARARAD